MFRFAGPACEMNWTINPPTEPGVYWFQEDGSSRGILGEVRVTNGPLTVMWTDIDRAEATFRARWRGPLLSSTGGRYSLADSVLGGEDGLDREDGLETRQP